MKPVLIFDGDCGFCTKTANLVKQLDAAVNGAPKLRVLPNHTDDLLAETGLTFDQTLEAAWFVDAKGRQFRGAGAVNTALATIHWAFEPLVWLYALTPLRAIEDDLYAWVARNRYRMPGSTAACKVEPASSRVNTP